MINDAINKNVWETIFTKSAKRCIVNGFIFTDAKALSPNFYLFIVQSWCDNVLWYFPWFYYHFFNQTMLDSVKMVVIPQLILHISKHQNHDILCFQTWTPQTHGVSCSLYHEILLWYDCWWIFVIAFMLSIPLWLVGIYYGNKLYLNLNLNIYIYKSELYMMELYLALTLNVR